MAGLIIMLLNAACAAWNISTETWWLLPINVVGILIGVMVAVNES